MPISVSIDTDIYTYIYIHTHTYISYWSCFFGEPVLSLSLEYPVLHNNLESCYDARSHLFMWGDGPFVGCIFVVGWEVGGISRSIFFSW